MIKKILAVILVLTLVVPLVVFGVLRTDVSAEDEGIECEFKNGVLTISGTGDMDDYMYTSYAPWGNLINQISQIVIKEGVTSIGKNAFRGATVKFVTFPNSLTKIGNYAFYDCNNLVEVIMPDSITEIGEHSFYSCDNLETLVLSNQLKSIPYEAFSGCKSLKELTIPSSVKYVGNYSFYNNSAVLKLSEGLETIGEHAFCGIENDVLILPDSLSTIGQYSFENCSNLTKLVTGENLIKIGGAAFRYSEKVTTIDLSKSQKLPSIGGGAFDGTSITSLIIPDSVTNIDVFTLRT